MALMRLRMSAVRSERSKVVLDGAESSVEFFFALTNAMSVPVAAMPTTALARGCDVRLNEPNGTFNVLMFNFKVFNMQWGKRRGNKTPSCALADLLFAVPCRGGGRCDAQQVRSQGSRQ